MNYLLLCLSVLALLNLALVKSQDDSFIQYFRKVDRKRSTDSEYLIKIADLKEEILSLKKEVNEEKNSKSLLQSQNHEFYQRIIEDKNEITILKEKIIELNHSVNEEKNNKSILEKENSELKKKIQKFCGLFDQDGSENIIQALEKGSLNGVKYWHCKNPSSIHANNGTYFNWTPLHYASRNGQLDIVEFLLSKGVDVNEEDSSNVTPLMSASYNGNVHVVKALLDKGAKINHQDADKWTPLHFAVDNNKLPVVKLLIERGADRSLRNGRNLTPLDWAREEGLKSIEDYLSSL